MGPEPQEEAAAAPCGALGGRLEESIPEGCLGEVSMGLLSESEHRGQVIEGTGF